MLAALQGFFAANQFGKTYSEIDREEQAALELQAQTSTATSTQKAALLSQRNMSQPVLSQDGPIEASLTSPKVQRNGAEKQGLDQRLLFADSNVRDILSDSNSSRYALSKRGSCRGSNYGRSIRASLQNRQQPELPLISGEKSPSLQMTTQNYQQLSTHNQQQAPSSSFFQFLAGACCITTDMAAANESQRRQMNLSLSFDKSADPEGVEGQGWHPWCEQDDLPQVANESSRNCSSRSLAPRRRLVYGSVVNKESIISQESLLNVGARKSKHQRKKTKEVTYDDLDGDGLTLHKQDSNFHQSHVLPDVQPLSNCEYGNEQREGVAEVSFLQLQSRLSESEYQAEDQSRQSIAQYHAAKESQANEHQRLAAQIKTRARSKTQFKRKESPYTTSSVIKQVKTMAEPVYELDSENCCDQSNVQEAYHSFTSQHEIQESYFKKSAASRESSATRRKSGKKQRALDKQAKQLAQLPAEVNGLTKQKEGPRRGSAKKASFIAAKKLAKASFTDKDISLFGIKTKKQPMLAKGVFRS